MISQPFLLMVSLAYVIILIAVAWLGENKVSWHKRLHPLIYALTLGVYCSSWTFFGAVGTASTSDWAYLPIYVGPILLFLFGSPFLQRLVNAGSRQKTTSIADFIGSRYGKRQSLAGLVALMAVIGSLPYIALQLQAVSMAWDTLAVPVSNQFIAGPKIDNALFIALFLAAFSMLFGTRHIESRERNRGMMSALAVESLVKIIALIVVSVLALLVIMGVPEVDAQALRPFWEPWMENPINGRFITMVLIAMLAIICLPRQFHVMVVEYQNEKDLKLSKWFFPLYLAIISLLVPLITLAGQILFSGSPIPPDLYVLQLPMSLNVEIVAIIVFIGGFSAATGMTIVAVITLAIMVSNEIILPVLLRWGGGDRIRHALYFGRYLRWVRRLCITGVLLAAWLMNRSFQEAYGLASIGLISFACFAQLAPALIGAIYWRRGHAYGVYAGLAAGFTGWFYCLLLPATGGLSETVLLNGPFAIDWLRPANLFGVSLNDPLSQGVFWSLGPNLLLYIVVSLFSRQSELDRMQADSFVYDQVDELGEDAIELSSIQVGRLKMLLDSFVDEKQSWIFWRKSEAHYRQRLLDDDRAPDFVVQEADALLSGVVGSSSAQRAIQLLERAEPLRFKDIAEIVGGTSEQLKFNKDLLQTTVETVTQGISVVDANLKLIAWNRRYEELFEYPPRLLYVGCPIETVYRHNAGRGMYADGTKIETQVARRLKLLRTGSEHQFERRLPSGVFIQVVGKPMDHGGFVTTFTDVSDFKALVSELEEAKQSLESRVRERTIELESANSALAEENQLRAVAEQEIREIHASKSRVMQAASHDLMQPISAAKLFVSSLQLSAHSEQSPQPDKSNEELLRQLGRIDSSLDSAEHLIGALREIARLESGKMMPKFSSFTAGSLIDELAEEFVVLSGEKGIAFRSVMSAVTVESDRNMLRRILQNFLSNALHYTKRGRILLGTRRLPGGLCFEVLDTGPGINPDDMNRIFNEFERLNPGATSADKGLGLGLTISKRMADLLEHPIEVRSEPGKGSVFSVTVPLGVQEESVARDEQPDNARELFSNITVLCIDNETDILEGMQAVLSGFGCEVLLASGPEEVEQFYSNAAPDIILLDYHLEENLNGLQLRRSFPESWQLSPAILISADNSDEIKLKADAAGCEFLKKPVQIDRLAQKIGRLLSR